VPSRADLLRLGYWPSRQLSGELPLAIRSVDEDVGGKALNIACTQTGLPAGQQRRIVNEWVRRLPTVRATTVVFSSKVSQDLFDAACGAPNLRALSIKWSSCRSLAQLKQAKLLRALSIGSSPEVTDLSPISELPNLKYLFIENVRGPVNLSFLRRLRSLREFGLSASRGKRLKVISLKPLASLDELEMVWLISLQIMQGGLRPLHELRRLKSLRTTMRAASSDLIELRAAAPSLQYLEPVG
jgi:hypothetical protein